jgi:hypothetical protein
VKGLEFGGFGVFARVLLLSHEEQLQCEQQLLVVPMREELALALVDRDVRDFEGNGLIRLATAHRTKTHHMSSIGAERWGDDETGEQANGASGKITLESQSFIVIQF